MKLWFVSMECAGIAEAGGVKNVTFSLCKEFSDLTHRVTLFIPVYKCTTWENLKINNEEIEKAQIELCGRVEQVEYTKAVCTNGQFDVVLVNHNAFAEKEGVYTYTEHEQSLNPLHKKGQGHDDLLFKDVLFQRAVSCFCSRISTDDYPDIIHSQDASTALLPAFINELKLKKEIKTVVTIHNAGPFYHHEFKNLDEALWYTKLKKSLLEKSLNKNRVEPFLIAHNSGAVLTTVSEDYAKELMDPANVETTDGLAPIFYQQKVFIKGITNGFDFDRYNPEDKKISKLPFEFSPEKGDLQGKYECRNYFFENVIENKNSDFDDLKLAGNLELSGNNDEIYLAYHGRITTQKGISILISAIPLLVKKFPMLRFVIGGQGESVLENQIIGLCKKLSGKVFFINGYNQSVMRLFTAACDFIILPSFFEPCGLEDFTAQCYGTLPVAHKTGGLNKIIDEYTGFLYQNNTPKALSDCISKVVHIKKDDSSKIFEMIKTAARLVHEKYYWKNVVKDEYLEFFKEILKNSKCCY